MFKLVIQDDEGKTTEVPLIRDEITIGRKEGNTIRLTERNVSRRHARILRNNGEVHIEDLGSYNGIRVNNARIAERVSLRVSDQVQIGDYKLYLKAQGHEQADDAHTIPLDRPESHGPTDAMNAVAATPLHPVAPPTAPPGLIGPPNRTQVAIGDTDPASRSIGPATAAAIAAMNAPGGYGRLVVLSSNFAGKEFELSRPQMSVGRTDENDIAINHRSISRNHAKLVREPDTLRYTISDLQSSNGVRVNGQDYGKVELRRGDIVDLGHVRLRFVEPGEDFVLGRDAVVTDVPEAGSKRGLVVAVLAAIVVLIAGVAIYTIKGSDRPSDGGDNAASSASSVAVADAAEPAVVVPDVDAAAPAVVSPGTAPGTTAPGTTTPVTATPGAGKPDDVKTQLGKCTELATQSNWQGLDDCASALSALGAKERAGEFHDKAVRETQNERRKDELQRAIHDINLKGAQAALKEIGEDSVYFKTARDAFTKAENQAIEQAKRAAQNFVTAHDCVGIRRYHAQLKEGNTERVAQAAGALVGRCVAPNQPAAPPTEPKTPSTPVVTAPPPPQRPACDPAEVEEQINQAKDQFNHSYPKAALNLMHKVVTCRPEIRMYQLAAMYACAAHDVGAARQYFKQIPPAQQASIEQKCQLEKVDIRGP